MPLTETPAVPPFRLMMPAESAWDAGFTAPFLAELVRGIRLEAA